jgi:uncharacterized damage-inducible protein DinB
MAPDTNEPLAQVLRYNRWANERIVDACRSLTDGQLDEHVQGAEERTIRETVFHIAAGQLDFVARMGGQAQDRGQARTWAGFEALAETLARGSDALLEAAEGLVLDADIVVPYMDKRPAFPKSLFITHAVAHGTMHRTEICMMMRAIGVEPPNLDGWEYAAAMGFGAES